jgi:hypothetical protein
MPYTVYKQIKIYQSFISQKNDLTAVRNFILNRKRKLIQYTALSFACLVLFAKSVYRLKPDRHNLSVIYTFCAANIKLCTLNLIKKFPVLAFGTTVFYVGHIGPMTAELNRTKALFNI